MKQLTALAWKEWHEVRAFLWIGLGVFLGLPVIMGAEAMLQYSKRFEVSAMPWVWAFGGFLAVFVAVGATCRDFSGRLQDFWSSRPIGVFRWLLVKYIVGIGVVLVACVVPLVVQWCVNRPQYEAPAPRWYVFILEMSWFVLLNGFQLMLPVFYSVAFLAGCLVRRAAHAAMLALATMLLVICLPIVFPPLQWLSVASATSLDSVAKFAGGMLGISLAALVLALVAAQRGWRIESGRKMMYWAVAVAILIPFGSAAFQLGTNMPVLQEIALPPGETVRFARCAGNWGYLWTEGIGDLPGFRTSFVPFQVTDSGVKLLPAQHNPQFTGWNWREVFAPGDSTVSYFVMVIGERDSDNDVCELNIQDYAANTVQSMRLWELPSKASKMQDWDEDAHTLYAWKDKLYVIGRRLITVDISNPRQPRIISDMPFSYAFMTGDDFARARYGVGFMAFSDQAQTKRNLTLPPIPGLPAEQRLEATLAQEGYYTCFDGEILCESVDEGLAAYRLVKLTHKSAEFQPIGQYNPTILESAFGSYRQFDLHMVNGLVFTRDGGWYGQQSMINPDVNVYDVKGPGGIRLVGHFAAPDLRAMCVLPDGRVLVGGNKLWLVGPPARRDAQ